MEKNETLDRDGNPVTLPQMAEEPVLPDVADPVLRMALDRLEHIRAQARRDIDKVRESLLTDGSPDYAATWLMHDAVAACDRYRTARNILFHAIRIVADEGEAAGLAWFLETLEDQARSDAYRTERPWRPNSTSPWANCVSMAEDDGLRESVKAWQGLLTAVERAAEAQKASGAID